MSINLQRRIGILLGYINIAAGALVSLLYTPFMLRLLGQSEYGLYTLAFSVVGYLNLLGFGLNGSYLRFCSKYIVDDDKDGLSKLNGTFISVNLVICFITLIVGSVIILFTDKFYASSLTLEEIQLTKELLIVLVINTAITFPLSVFSSYITANERFVFLKGINVIKTVCSPLLCIAILLMGYRSLGMVICTTVITVLVELIHAVYCIKILDFKASFITKHEEMFKSIMKFSLFVFIQTITDQINWSLDSIILAKMLGSIATAVYGLAATLNGYLRQFSTIMTSVYAPQANKMVADECKKEKISTLFLKVGRIQFLIVTYVLTGFILVGRYFISIWGGEGYEESYVIAVLLMCSVTPAMFLNLGIEIRRAMNMHQKPAIVTFFTAVFNACLTIPCVYFFGVKGAAIGTMIACYANAGYMTRYYYKTLKLDMKTIWIGIIEVSIPVFVSFVFGVIFRQFYLINNTLSFVLALLMYSLIFWGLVLGYIKIKKIPLLMEV